ncbi:MAG: HAD-IIA family hydrolase [Acidimicrobiia bacterium]
MAAEPGADSRSGNIVLDLDGVLYLSDEGIPGAAKALRALESRGYRLLLATNNSTRRRQEVADFVATAIGYDIDPKQILTSALASARLLGRDDSSPAYVVGEDGLVATLEAEGIGVTGDWRQAAAVVIGLDRAFNYERLRDASLAIRAGARFVATNTDATFPTPDGLWPGGGSMVAALVTATGVEPEVAGKPHPPMTLLIKEHLGPGPTWVVGDRPETDLALAVTEGWRKVLVLTGVTKHPEAVPAHLRPDLVVDSIAELPERLTRSDQ